MLMSQDHHNFLFFKCINYIPKEMYMLRKQKHLGHKSNIMRGRSKTTLTGRCNQKL